MVSEQELAQRIPLAAHQSDHQHGTGRELFATFRGVAASAELGASSLYNPSTYNS
jgi:dihydroxyacid dehydratase/phosphogluconate dehydratase